MFSAPLSSRDGGSDDMRGYLMVIRTFCQPEASEPVDTQRLTSSSAPLSSKDGESDDMQRYPSGYLYKTISVNPDPRSQVAGGDTQVVIRINTLLLSVRLRVQ